MEISDFRNEGSILGVGLFRGYVTMKDIDLITNQTEDYLSDG